MNGIKRRYERWVYRRWVSWRVLESHEVLNLVEQAVKAVGPDYRPQKIGGYTRLDAKGDVVPNCIVGWVIHRWGVPLEIIAQDNDMPIRFRMLNEPYLASEYPRPFNATHEAVKLLTTAQRMSDLGNDWGTVLRVLKEDYEWVR